MMEYDLSAQAMDCIAWCRKEGILPLVIHSPQALGPRTLAHISANDVVGLSSGYDAATFRWPGSAPSAKAIAIIAPRGFWACFSFYMAMTARKSGIIHLVQETPTGWKKQRLSVFLSRRFAEKIFWTACGSIARRIPRPCRGLRKACAAFCAPHGALYAPVPGRIVFFNNALASGGAERQSVNTLRGLAQHGHTDLRLLCNHLHFPPGSDFYLHHLEAAHISAGEIARAYSEEDKENLHKVDALFSREIEHLPEQLSEAILTYALEIMRVKPDVVHAWQDSTSILVGLAAVMAGVPRIVLGGRNMAPHRFAYFQPWMRPAYQALAKHPSVVMLNNSTAGARDYEKWLGLPEGHIRILFNGMHGDTLVRAPQAEVDAWRAELGIPEGSRIVGSIFRLYPEKDPMLWVETAALVAQKHPETAFLILGDGPLRAKTEDAIRKFGLEKRFFLPGVDRNNTRALSAMDAFLLSSRLEGTPNVCIEAQWLGVPVVSTDAGGSADTFDDGKTGFLVRTRKAGDLAEKVSFILDHPDWAKQAAENAPAFVQARFNMERMISETLDVYGLAE